MAACGTLLSRGERWWASAASRKLAGTAAGFSVAKTGSCGEGGNQSIKLREKVVFGKRQKVEEGCSCAKIFIPWSWCFF